MKKLKVSAVQQVKVVNKTFSLDEDDFAYAFYKLLEPVISRHLAAYRELKHRKSAAEKTLSDLVNQKSGVLTRIKELSALIPKLEHRLQNIVSLALVSFIITIILAVLESSAWIIASLVFFGFVILYFSTRASLGNAKTEITQLMIKVKELEREIQSTRAAIERATEEMKTFTLPKVVLKAYRCYLPTVIMRNPLGEKVIVLTPWSSGEVFKITYVTSSLAVEEARGKLTLGEHLYLDAALRGKEAGYKIVDSFRRMNLWERILESRSPERVLREIVEESYRILMSAVETGEEVLKLEMLDAKSVKVLSELFTRADGALPGPLHERSEAIVKGEREKLNYIAEAVKGLGGVRSYVEEAREIVSKREIYASIVDLAVREVIARTLPIEQDVAAFFFVTIYCKRCAERLIEDYVSQLDLRKWVFSEILGGVDRDPDLVSPEETVKDIVEEVWKKLEERVYRELPLPGVSGDEPFEELVRKYDEALRKYALPFTGAEERVEMYWVSAFQGPVLKCSRCGAKLSSEDYFMVENLRHPLIKGYAGLLAERQRDLLDRSSEIVTAVNNARLHKDGRKTTIGIYMQMMQSMEQEVRKLELDAIEAEMHRKSLMKYLTPLLAAPAIQDLLSALPEHEALGIHLESVLKVIGGET